MIGKTINGYLIIKQIGSGGNATVFECSKNNKIYAIKIIVSEKDRSSKIQRFLDETDFLKTCDCENIVKYIDSGECDCLDSNNSKNEHLFYLVMPRLSCNFRTILNDNKIPLEEKLKYFIDICKGLEYAHNRSAIHRDIKPENVLIDLNRKIACIADFGIAHFKDVSRLTKKKDRMANFLYASPEQRELINEDVCFASDNYSLGLILNEIFTGRVPLGEDYNRIVDVNHQYFELDKVVSSLIKNSPNERTQQVGFVISDMERVINEIKYLENEIKVNVGSIGRKNKTIESVAYPDVAFVYNAIRKGLYLENVSYSFHRNIVYTLSDEFLNSLFATNVLEYLIILKRQYDRTTWKKTKGVSRAHYKKRNKLSKWLNKLSVLPDFEYVKQNFYDIAYHLTDYHFEEVFEEAKRRYELFENENRTVAINHLYSLMAQIANKYEWFTYYNFYSLFRINFTKSSTFIDDSTFFISQPKNIDERIFELIYKKYGIVVRTYIEKNHGDYLVTLNESSKLDPLIEDLRTIQNTKFEDDDVRIVDIEDLIDDLNNIGSFDEVQKNSTFISRYGLSLMVNHLFPDNDIKWFY